MLGKRNRHTFKRTSSMSGVTVGVGNVEAAAIGGEFDHMLSPRYDVETADFLRSCGLCDRPLTTGRDIYMYRGDTAFCSLECRDQQMKQDERAERRAAAKSDHREVAAATPEAETVAAA